MENHTSLSEHIAASIEDVKALLDDNRSLSIAYLSRRIRDLEDETRKRLRGADHGQNERLTALEGSVKKLEERLHVAAVKYREMQEDLGKIDKTESQ